MPDFVLQWVYAPGDFNTAGPLDAVPNEQGAQAQGSPPWQLQLNGSATPQQITVTDDDNIFNEIGDPGQVLTNAVTIDGTTYAAGSRVVINYVITTDDGFEGYSITLGSNNSGNNTTTAFITNTPMVPGQTYEFTSEGNIGNSTSVTYPQFACFAAGTMIATPEGERPIEQIEPGDLVITRDRGALPVRWLGKRTVPGAGQMAPIVFKAGVLGATSDLTVSPNHRMLVTGVAPQLCLGEDEALVAAKALANGTTILRRPTGFVTYVHLMFDSHQIVCGNGTWSESFFTGDQAIDGLDSEQREELLNLFPELGRLRSCGLARRSAKIFEGQVMAVILAQ